jgi:16S rRNA (guanine966-N2)-methyltransferase
LTLKIIAGEKRGLKLFVPDPTLAKPTSAKVREAIFSILGEKVPSARVLDLYAGSGAMALEAISRGAESATCADENQKVLKTIGQNIALFGKDKDIVALAASFPKDINLLIPRSPYDLIFLDPPYRDIEVPQSFLKLAIKTKLIAPSATLVWEMASSNLARLELISFTPWTVWKSRSWGKKAALFLEL